LIGVNGTLWEYRSPENWRVRPGQFIEDMCPFQKNGARFFPSRFINPSNSGEPSRNNRGSRRNRFCDQVIRRLVGAVNCLMIPIFVGTPKHSSRQIIWRVEWMVSPDPATKIFLISYLVMENSCARAAPSSES